MDGFFLIDKESKMTSHDVLLKLRRKLNVSKMGHTGTLDPLASGLMVVCSGKATKLAYLFEKMDKTYQGILVFGSHYDTYDTTGSVIETNPYQPEEPEIVQGMKAFEKTYHQEPPMYSAIKQDGQKLYELARKGMDVERKKREVTVYRFDPISPLQQREIAFEAKVSKGTYIRSLVVDLAQSLGALAAISQLRRIEVGPYTVSNAKEVKDIMPNDIVPLSTFFKDYPRIMLNDYMIKLVRNGIYLDERQTQIQSPFIVVDHDHLPVAYYEPIDSHRYQPMLIF